MLFSEAVGEFGHQAEGFFNGFLSVRVYQAAGRGGYETPGEHEIPVHAFGRQRIPRPRESGFKGVDGFLLEWLEIRRYDSPRENTALIEEFFDGARVG